MVGVGAGCVSMVGSGGVTDGTSGCVGGGGGGIAMGILSGCGSRMSTIGVGEKLIF